MKIACRIDGRNVVFGPPAKVSWNVLYWSNMSKCKILSKESRWHKLKPLWPLLSERNPFKSFQHEMSGLKRSWGITGKGRWVLSLNVSYVTLYSISANTIPHSGIHSFFFTSSENCLGYRNYHLCPLCVFWLRASYLLTQLNEPRLCQNCSTPTALFQQGKDYLAGPQDRDMCVCVYI